MLDLAVKQSALEGGEYALVSSLLSEALQLLEVDASGARYRIECARRLFRRENETAAKRGVLAGWQLRRAETYIHNHFDSALRIKSVASEVNLSASYFSRAFKATVGITYSEFILRARIDLAKRLLLTTDTSIANIALACGMNDQSYLTRTFGQVVGAPPAAWRRKHRGDFCDRQSLPQKLPAS